MSNKLFASAFLISHNSESFFAPICTKHLPPTHTHTHTHTQICIHTLLLLLISVAQPIHHRSTHKPLLFCSPPPPARPSPLPSLSAAVSSAVHHSESRLTATAADCWDAPLHQQPPPPQTPQLKCHGERVVAAVWHHTNPFGHQIHICPREGRRCQKMAQCSSWVWLTDTFGHF